MNILITGANGFLGKEFTEYFSREHCVFPMSRQSLDVSNSEQVDDFFRKNKVDVVLHTAVKGGKRQSLDTFSDLLANLDMYRNLEKHRDKYGAMFCFCSGAAFDRSRDIRLVKEENLSEHCPSDYYGLSKNLIGRRIQELDSNIINLRLFGCFGKYEEDTRLIKSTFIKIKNREPVSIARRCMDFFYVRDLCKIIDFYSKNLKNDLPRDLNVVYNNKISTLYIVKEIQSIVGCSDKIIIKNYGDKFYYNGEGQKLKGLDIDLDGLRAGMEEMYGEFYSESDKRQNS